MSMSAPYACEAKAGEVPASPGWPPPEAKARAAQPTVARKARAAIDKAFFMVNLLLLYK
jgi:hypothetical protein